MKKVIFIFICLGFLTFCSYVIGIIVAALTALTLLYLLETITKKIIRKFPYLVAEETSDQTLSLLRVYYSGRNKGCEQNARFARGHKNSIEKA
jgi:hypothetical protein